MRMFSTDELLTPVAATTLHAVFLAIGAEPVTSSS
jgi:hypothetical protein